MSVVTETRFLVQHGLCECNSGLNQSVCNSKQKWNHKECQSECKEIDNWDFCENDYIWNPSTCNCECNRACKIDEYLDTKYCSCEKRLIGKLVLECEDEILNTTESSLDDKKVTCAKNNCLIHTISLGVICLLLLVIICASCYFYHTKYRSKQSLPFPLQQY